MSEEGVGKDCVAICGPECTRRSSGSSSVFSYIFVPLRPLPTSIRFNRRGLLASILRYSEQSADEPDCRYEPRRNREPRAEVLVHSETIRKSNGQTDERRHEDALIDLGRIERLGDLKMQHRSLYNQAVDGCCPATIVERVAEEVHKRIATFLVTFVCDRHAPHDYPLVLFPQVLSLQHVHISDLLVSHDLLEEADVRKL